MRVPEFVALLLAGAGPVLAHAQAAPAPPAPEPEAFAEDEDSTLVEEIVVTGSSARQRGAVIGDIEPEVQLDAREIRALGVGSVTELLDALAPQTQSARGRGGGRPVVLLNGRRTSGFAEVRNLPPEAILRVDVLPEEVALKYGFRADQRVVNIVLRPRFRAVTAQVAAGAPTQGGRASTGFDLNPLRITPDGRWSIELEHDRSSSILESERGLTGAPGRTLAPETESLALNATLNRTVFDTVSATINAGLEASESLSRFGRAAEGEDADAPARTTETTVGRLGAALNGDASEDWRWSLTGGLSRTRTDTETTFVPSEARTVDASADAQLVLSGPLLQLPAGPLSTTFRTEAEARRFETEAERNAVRSAADLSRDRGAVQVSLDAPVAERGGPLGRLGDLSLNANVEIEQVSDFGTLRVLGGGATWSPVRRLQIIASVTDEDGAPTVQQLGDPVLLTPDTPVFDFRTGRTVEVTQVTGGSPDLSADNRQVRKLGLTLRPFEQRDLSLTANYTDTRIENPIAALPEVTPDIEAAFPDRFLRDEAGRLLQVDTRPVNFARSARREVRTGLNYSRRLGGPPEGRPPGAFERNREGVRPPRDPSGAPRARGGLGAGARFGGRSGAGRLQFALYHTWRLEDSVVIRDGLPELDLLDGAAVGSGGGRPEHELDLQAGVSRRGLGARLEANWRAGTVVRGGAAAGLSAGDLAFDDRTTVNLNLFADLGQRRNLVSAYPWLRGARLSLAVTNLLDSRQDVRDETGAVPAGYLPDRLDPVGRSVRFTVRKLAF